MVGVDPPRWRLWEQADDSRADNRVEKYRPESLDDVVSHKDITNTSKLVSFPPKIMSLTIPSSSSS